MTGLDLAKYFVMDHEKEVQDVGLGMMDSSFYNENFCKELAMSNTNSGTMLDFANRIHGKLVGDVLVGFDGATDVRKGFHQFVFDNTALNSEIFSAVERATQSKEGLKVLNLSFVVTDEARNQYTEYVDNLLIKFGELDKKGVILVTAAGNDAKTNEAVYQYTEKFPGIVVGGVTSSGQKWAGSQISKKVKIMAPAEGIAVSDSTSDVGKYQTGTSLSTPIVSGSIVNALKFLPNMNRSQIETLIEKSAVKMQDSKNRDGSNSKLSLINSYKMVRVAERIKKLAEFKIFANPREKEKFITGFIESDWIYNFKEEAQRLLKKATTLEAQEKVSCMAQWRILDMYREAFFSMAQKKPAFQL